MLSLRSPLARSLAAAARPRAGTYSPSRGLLARQFSVSAPPRAPVRQAGLLSRKAAVPPAAHVTRAFSTSFARAQDQKSPEAEAEIPVYDFQRMKELSDKPDPKRLIIDVRDASELDVSGTIPNSINISLHAHPNPFSMPAALFKQQFGISKPKQDTELIFSCKSGVRSLVAAKQARQEGYPVVSYKGSWMDWAANTGGKTY